MKKFLLPLCILLLAIACSPKTAPAGAGKATSDIIILYDNDVHCSADGYANMAALKTAMKERTPYVLLVSSGDFVQGGSLGAASKGGYIVEVMNAAGYDYVTLGNHEFDYAIPRLVELSNQLDAKVLCCNLLDLKADRRMYDASTIVDFGGTKVAFIGVATPYSFSSSTPAFFQDEKGNYVYSLCAENLYDYVQNYIDDVRNQGVDYVVLMTHLGDNVETDPINAHSLIRNTNGVDVILDGHSHNIVPSLTLVNKDGKNVLYSQTGSHFENLGVLTIKPDGRISTELIPLGEFPAKDPAVEAVLNKVKKAYADRGARKIGFNEAMLPATDPQGNWLVRSEETSLGDLCADAFRVCLGTEIAMLGGGSLRKNLPAGEIRYDDIFNVFPFNNVCCTASLTGAQILDALEYGVADYPTAFGGFPHVSGLTFEFDPSVETPIVYDINRTFVRVDAGERRVRNVRVLNSETGLYEPIDPTKVYTVGGTTYMLRDAGDGYEMLKGLGQTTGQADIDILEQYIVEKLGGHIPASTYGGPAGRVIRK